MAFLPGCVHAADGAVSGRNCWQAALASSRTVGAMPFSEYFEYRGMLDAAWVVCGMLNGAAACPKPLEGVELWPGP